MKKNFRKDWRFIVFFTFMLLSVSAIPYLFNTKISHAAEVEAMEREGYISPSLNLLKKIQQNLIEKGYDPGPVDGLWGPKTLSAFRLFLKDNGLEENHGLYNGILTKKTLDIMFSLNSNTP